MQSLFWVLLCVKIAFADEDYGYGTEPQCRNAPICPSNDKECGKCDLSNSTLNIVQTALPGRYGVDMLGNDSCRVQVLEIFIYYLGSQCPDNVNNNYSDKKSHSYGLYKCLDKYYNTNKDQIISSEDTKNETKPKINLTYYADMMFGGCYKITYSINGRRPISIEKFIKNNYTQNYFEDLISNFSFVTSIVGPSSELKLVFPIKFGRNEYTIHSMKYDENATVDWTNLTKLSYTSYGSELTVAMPNNTTPGNYEIYFNLYTGWCQGTILKGCSRSLIINVPEPAPDHSIPVTTSHQGTLLVVTVMFIIILAIILFRFLINKCVLPKKDKLIIPLQRYPNVQPERVQLKAIVLVYARDCEQLMNVVAELRKLLQERCMVKVYDVFDVRLMHKEIGKAPEAWASAMLRTPGVAFVLVKTRCGELLYEPIIMNNGEHFHLQAPLLPTHTHYRTPAYADEYVNLLFRLVKEDAVLAEPYNKYFVVQIPSFSGDRQFGHVCPFRRYRLPSTTKLVSDLLGSDDNTYTPGEPEERLEAVVDILRNYVDENPDYVLSLLEDS